MMVGMGLMLMIGLLVMLLVFGLPIFLVLVLAGGTAGFLRKQNQAAPALQNPKPVFSAAPESVSPISAPSRYCTHCGAGMQADWTHCPQCGAPKVE